MDTLSPSPTHRHQTSALARAWAAVAVIPAFFLLAFAAGEGTLSLLGYSSGHDVPLGAGLVADVVATAVLLVPCLTAVVSGNRARRAGVAGAALPTAIGAAAGVAALLLLVITETGNVI